MTLTNPDFGDAFEGVRVEFRMQDTSADDIASIQYYEVNDGNWYDLPFTQDGNDLVGWFGPSAGFPMPAPYNATSMLRVKMAAGATGTYTSVMKLYDVKADPDVLLTTFESTMTVLESATLTAGEFAYVYKPEQSRGSWLGVSTSWTIKDGTVDDAESITVKMFGEDENGSEILLQTNTANMERFTGFASFNSPFNIYGK